MKPIKNFVFYYPIEITARTLREAKEELSLDFEVDPIFIQNTDYIKYLKTSKPSKQDLEFYHDKQAEYKEMGY
ncbi:MAG: hypothetical protein KJI69_03510 [Patescibacteria group bacterium]|nr:hypothetical protein [Patescibacteria group bacterium]